MPVAYLFEARSIQSYLFAGGKLRDMMSASDMVDRLCDQVLDQALAQLAMTDECKASGNLTSVRFPRRAGGAFYALLDDKAQAKKLRDLWSFTVARYLPGLEALHVIAEGASDAEAVGNGQKKLLAARNMPPAALPEGGPLVVRCQRTGLPAVDADSDEPIDAALRRRRQSDKESDSDSGQRRLGRKFLSARKEETNAAKYVFPCDFELSGRERNDPYVFPFNNEKRTVAIVHADGNGLGIILRQLSKSIESRPEEYAQAFRGFSEALERATETAAQQATAEVLKPAAKQHPDNRRTLPARPLVLGGDDLTTILRADLALAFTQKFIEAFETSSEKELTQWQTGLKSRGLSTEGLPSYLTACAGIVFIRANQPFSQAYELAESLCQRAKKASDTVTGKLSMKPSSLSFARITTSCFDDAEELFQQTVPLDDTEGRLTLGTYGVGRHADALPSLQALERLHSTLASDEVSSGPARKLMTVLQQDLPEAQRLWSRWLEVLRERQAEAQILDALKGLAPGEPIHAELPFVKTPTLGWATPLGDIHDLMAVGHTSLSDIHKGNPE